MRDVKTSLSDVHEFSRNYSAMLAEVGAQSEDHTD